MQILDIDMDFFQNKILMHGDKNYNTTECKTWNEFEFRNFLENNLKLSNKEKINGIIVERHHEAIKYLRNIVCCKEKNKIIHVDAHADLGYIGDASYLYLNKINYTNSNDIYSHPEYGKRFCVSESNFLLFAIAEGLFNEIDYLYHPQLEEDGEHDLPPAAKLKCQNRHNIYELELSSTVKVPINMCRYKTYFVNGEIAYVIISKSPDYCVSDVPSLIRVAQEYINIQN